jgi:16S rRNA (guanine(966)-N(2))-methyltransferase RsmD
MGIEAISRGAKMAYFVDSSKKSLETVKRNIKATKFESNSKVFQMDYHSFLAMNSTPFDIVFLDPPYRTGMLQESLALVAESVKDTGVIIAENPLDEELSKEYGEFLLDRQYRYGKIKISTYRHKDFLG